MPTFLNAFHLKGAEGMIHEVRRLELSSPLSQQKFGDYGFLSLFAFVADD